MRIHCVCGVLCISLYAKHVGDMVSGVASFLPPASTGRAEPHLCRHTDYINFSAKMNMIASSSRRHNNNPAIKIIYGICGVLKHERKPIEINANAWPHIYYAFSASAEKTKAKRAA